MDKNLKQINCPLCGNPMDIRIVTREHANSVSKTVKKSKYYQYHCDQCSDGVSGWTTTESDEASIKKFGK